MTRATAFDRLAADYDRTFTASTIGRRMRAAVWRRLDPAFAPGDRILELNCGTGEDAVHLAQRGVHVTATDVSLEMLSATQSKVDRAGLSGLVEVRRLAIEGLSALPPKVHFDGLLSNFGGLNCVSDLPAAARMIGQVLRPGGRALLCMMGPTVPWEWLWYVAHGQPRKALRRFGRRGARWRGLTIQYPSIGAVRRAFAPDFVARRVAAVGALVPPTYAESWAARHPRMLATMDSLERRFERVPPLPWLADHYLIELERRP